VASSDSTAGPLSDEQLEALVAEAEAGYDVEQLLARRARRERPVLKTTAAGGF